MKEAQRVWEKHEQPLELATILEQNFVKDRRITLGACLTRKRKPTWSNFDIER